MTEDLEGGDHFIAPLDVADPEAVADGFSAITGHFGRLDRVVFMAAVYSPHDGQPKDLAFIHDMLAVNLGGAFNMLDVVRPYFEAQGSGQIALCGSVAGYRGLPFGQPYCAGKAALISLAESLRIELKPTGVDVKVINPGFVKTPLTDKNDFPMPMMIEAEVAGRAIAKGLLRRGFEVHFPKRFTFLMKTLRILPAPVYFWLMNQIAHKL